MTITAAFVLYSVFWFMTFFVLLPLRLTTQGDAGDVVPGTHASAPAGAHVGRTARLTTWWATGLWLVATAVIVWGGITVRDIDWLNQLPPRVEPGQP